MESFLCPLGGEGVQVRPLLTSRGERQALVCEKHGILAFVGTSPVGNYGAGAINGQYSDAAVLDDIPAAAYAQATAGPFKGVWGVRPPGTSLPVVIVPTQYATVGVADDGVTPTLTVLVPFTGAWRGQLAGGVFYPAQEII